MSRVLRFLFAVSLFSSSLLAQVNQAAMTATPHKVKQGEQVTIQIKINPAPNVGGRVDVFVAPDGSSSPTYNGGNGVGPGQTNVGEIGITIPVDAKLGNWKVVQVGFQPANSARSDLVITGKVTFEVVKREAVLPTSAEVEVK
jgi:hypothetical protein